MLLCGVSSRPSENGVPNERRVCVRWGVVASGGYCFPQDAKFDKQQVPRLLAKALVARDDTEIEEVTKLGMSRKEMQFLVPSPKSPNPSPAPAHSVCASIYGCSNSSSSPRFLAVYSGVLTIVFAVTLLTGLAESRQRQKFAEIDVERINVVEPDGALRMVISNKASFPGIIIKGKETPHPDRKTAGMPSTMKVRRTVADYLGGSKDAAGKVSSYGHLSFDRYEQDQVFASMQKRTAATAARSCA